MKKFFTLLMTMMMAAGVYAGTWTVAGNNTDLFGTEWDVKNVANDLQLHSGTLYTWTKDVTALGAKDGVQFKVVKDHSWSESYPGDNYSLDVPAEAKYVVITFDESTKEVHALAYGTWTVAGDADLTGSGWSTTDVNNLMDTEDGYTFTWSKTDVALPMGVTQKFKIAKDQKWDVSYPASNYELAIPGGFEGTYDVAITFNAITKEVTGTVTLNDIKTTYSLIGGSGDWAEMGAMTQNGNKFEYTINNQEGDADLTFAILPDFADNEGTIKWADVVRPNANGGDNASWELNFVVNTDKSAITGTEKSWKVLKGEQVTITYDPVSNFWSSKTFLTKTVKDNARNIATFGLPVTYGKIQVPSGVAVYKAASKDDTTIQLQKVAEDTGIISLSDSKSVGFAIVGTPGTYRFEATNDDANVSFDGNLFVGTGTDANAEAPAGSYVLGNTTADGLAFYHTNTATTLGALKAYIEGGSSAKTVLFWDETNGIANLSSEKTDNVYYDLQGRRVMNPTKGLFIVNGKKVIK